MAVSDSDEAGVASDDVEVVRRAIELVGELDMDGVVALVTDDIVLEFPFRADGGRRRLEGEEALRFFRALPRLFSRMGMYDIVVHGRLASGVVVAEYRSDGLTRDGGAAYPNVYVAFLELRDGRICRWREYFDPNVVAAAFSPS